MPKITRSPKAGKTGIIRIGCSAFILDDAGSKVLLVKRIDNGRWAVPGGYMESGESLQAACEREVREETGLEVEATNLIAIYSDPDVLLEYPDGDKIQLVVLLFKARVIAGEFADSDETTDAGYFTLDKIKHMNVGTFDRQRIADGFAYQDVTIVSDLLHLS